MAENKTVSKSKGGKLVPALCNVIGILILLLVIATCLPMTIPKLMGYQIYNVESGSMDPEIPTGSVVYVKQVDPVSIVEGDIITFNSGESVVTHRAVKNQTVEGYIVTKGDANVDEDINPVYYESVIGKVVKHYPLLGYIMFIYTSTMGKIYVIIFAACGLMLNMVASRMRSRRRDLKVEELLAYMSEQQSRQ